MRTSNDPIYQRDGSHLVPMDELQDLLIRLRVGKQVGSV